MSSTTVLRSLKRWWWVLVALIVAGAAAGAIVSLLMTPAYESTSRIFVAFDAPAGAGSAELVQANNFAIQKVYSYVEVVKSPRVLDTVISDLKLQDTAQDLAMDISVTVPANSAVMQITATAASPQDAAALSQAVVDSFTDVVFEIETPTGGGVPPIRVESIETATPPDAPSSPKVLINVAIGMLLGFALGMLWVGIAAATDRRLYNSTDATAAAGADLRSLGSVPSSPTAKSVTVVADKPLSAVAESYRTIAATLGHSPSAKLGIVAVASVSPRDTASALTGNLALVFAEFGVRVAVVDANLRSGRISRSLGLDGPGLAEALTGTGSVLSLLQTVNGIDILPAGRALDSPAELIAGPRFDEILRELSLSYELVLIDSASVLPLSDTLFAAAAADATILSISSGRVTVRELRASIATLESVQATLAGGVVIGAPSTGVDADTVSAAFRDFRPKERARSGTRRS